MISPWDLSSRTPRRYRPSIWQSIARGFGLAVLTLLFMLLLGFIGSLGVYAYYASSLPSPQDLYLRTTSFKSTKIFDRHGTLLFEIFDPTGGRRTVVRYEQIPPVVIHAVVSTEDSTFFYNPGWNPFSIARSLLEDLRYQDVIYGGSTITQQLVKNIYLTREVTVSRKIKEAILATELTRRYSKIEILEVYLNEVYFGNLSYGIGAAAETYFGKPVSELNLSEAALLAGIIQSPALYDPYLDPEAALARRETVLQLMQQHGYLSAEEADAAAAQPLGVAPRKIVMEAPHMVMAVREELEQRYGTEMLYKGGFQVYTTLDLQMQHLAEQVAREQLAALRQRGASNTALVAMDSKTGDVLAMLGSVDFYDTSIDGQVNVARRLRQPGSSIKPFTYLAAMERGWTAATMLMDVAQQFPDGANPPYKPTNYDGLEYGPISLRTALACSRNIPAVSTLNRIGVPALLESAKRVGITSLNAPYYGLALTLGGGEVTLLEMTGAYGALANGGQRVTPRLILHIEDQAGEIVLPETTPETPQVMDPRYAYILTDILADDEARAPTFGRNSPLKLSFPAAAKTGTTNDYRDSWTVGYTPGLVAGVWVGNNDNEVMDRLSGGSGAALIWHDFMERALARSAHESFVRPPKIVEAEVCPISGMKRGDLCPPGRKELFLAENAPKEQCPVHVRVAICKDSGKLATSICPKDRVEEKVFQDYGPMWDKWAANHKIVVPPRESCPIHPEPTSVPTATATSQAARTEAAALSPTATPESATATPEATDTPLPTGTPAPSDTPVPTNTQEPQQQPSATPLPLATPSLTPIPTVKSTFTPPPTRQKPGKRTPPPPAPATAVPSPSPTATPNPKIL